MTSAATRRYSYRYEVLGTLLFHRGMRALDLEEVFDFTCTDLLPRDMTRSSGIRSTRRALRALVADGLACCVTLKGRAVYGTRDRPGWKVKNARAAAVILKVMAERGHV